MAVNEVPYQPLYDEGVYRRRSDEGASSPAAGAFASLGDYISRLAEASLKRNQANRENEHIHQMNNQSSAMEHLQTGLEAHPEDSTDILSQASHNPSLQGVDLGGMMPSVTRRTGGIGQAIEGAHSLDNLPTEGDVVSRAFRALTPTESAPQMGVTDINDGSNGNLPSTAFGPKSAPPIQDLINERNAKQAAIQSNTDTDISNKGKEAFSNAYQTHSGEDSATHDYASTKLGDDIDAIQGKAGPEAAAAGLKAGAEEDARVPSLEKLENDRFQHEKQLKDMEISNHPPPGTLVDEVSNMNMAEQEGVKVMRGLVAAGLVDPKTGKGENNPLNQRWLAFVQQNAKMASDDPEMMHLIQGTAASRAGMLRGFLGGRGGQYLADQYGQHMPDTKMTPQLLYSVLGDTLRQVNEKRDAMILAEYGPNSKVGDRLRIQDGNTLGAFQNEVGPTGPQKPATPEDDYYNAIMGRG